VGEYLLIYEGRWAEFQTGLLGDGVWEFRARALNYRGPGPWSAEGVYHINGQEAESDRHERKRQRIEQEKTHCRSVMRQVMRDSSSMGVVRSGRYITSTTSCMCHTPALPPPLTTSHHLVRHLHFYTTSSSSRRREEIIKSVTSAVAKATRAFNRKVTAPALADAAAKSSDFDGADQVLLEAGRALVERLQKKRGEAQGSKQCKMDMRSRVKQALESRENAEAFAGWANGSKESELEGLASNERNMMFQVWYNCYY
jgi:hypothetical protein